MKKKVAFYLRCSTEQQDYEYQENVMRNALPFGCELVKVYKEKISGFKDEDERPEMSALLNAVKEGQYDEIWATEYTRISRSQLNLLKIVQYLDNAPNARGGKGVNLHIVNGGYNTMDDVINEKDGSLAPDAVINGGTRMILSLMSAYGDIEVKTTRARMSNGKKDSVKNSNYVGGTLPYGYKYHDNGRKNKPIYVDEEEKAIVLRIFRDYCLKNMSLHQLTKIFNYEGILTKNQIENKDKRTRPIWRATTIRSILTCTFYIGEREYKGERIKLDDNLVFPELFEKVEGVPMYEYARKKLEENLNKPKPHGNVHILTGILRCSCGGKMRCRTCRSRARNYYSYTCYEKFLDYTRVEKHCHSDLTNINLEKLDSIIWTFLKNNIDEFKVEIEKQIHTEDKINAAIKLLKEKIKNVEDKKVEIKRQKERAFHAYVKGSTEPEFYENIMKDFNKQEKGLLKLVDDYNREIYQEKIKLKNWDIADEVKMNIDRIENDKELMKSYVQKLIKSILVYRANSSSGDVVIKIIANSVFIDRPSWIVFNTMYSRELEYYYQNWFGRPLDWDNERKIFTLETALSNPDQEHKALEWKTENTDPYLLSDEYFAATSGLPLEYVKGVKNIDFQEKTNHKFIYSVDEFKEDCKKKSMFRGVMKFSIYPILKKDQPIRRG